MLIYIATFETPCDDHNKLLMKMGYYHIEIPISNTFGLTSKFLI